MIVTLPRPWKFDARFKDSKLKLRDKNKLNRSTLLELYCLAYRPTRYFSFDSISIILYNSFIVKKDFLQVSLLLIINEAMILVYNTDVVLIFMYIIRKCLIFMSLLVPVFIYLNKVIL